MKNPFAHIFHSRDTPAERALPKDIVSSAPTFYFGTSSAGKPVNPRQAVQVSAVYACVRVLKLERSRHGRSRKRKSPGLQR